MKTDRRAPAPMPTYQQICDLAADLARQAGMEPALVKLVYYPAHASPPAGAEACFMGWAARIRDSAAAILRERMAALPRPKLPRRKKIRPNPFRGRTWTRRPLKHARPPPRRRRFLPPGLFPMAARPPRRLPDESARRPSRRDPEQLVFYTVLFDN